METERRSDDVTGDGWRSDEWRVTERRSDGVSGNGGNGGNIGGRFGRDGMKFGLNGKEMEWNMVHDRYSQSRNQATSQFDWYSEDTWVLWSADHYMSLDSNLRECVEGKIFITHFCSWWRITYLLPWNLALICLFAFFCSIFFYYFLKGQLTT